MSSSGMSTSGASFYSQFASTYESVFPFSRAVYAFLRRYLPLPPTAMLDIGCGTGHYAGALAGEGFDAVGVDLDAQMIAYAASHYPGATFRVMNMLDIAELGRRFDAAFCIGNTAAHLPQAAFSGFLDRVHETVAPEGTWVLQVMNWDYVLGEEEVTLPLIEGEGGVRFKRRYREITEERVIFETRLEVGGALVFSDATPLYPLRSDRIVALHEARGFRLLVHQGSYDGAAFDPGRFSANIFAFRR